MMGYWLKSLFYGMAVIAALLPVVAQAQGLSGRGIGMETESAVARQCDIDYRNLRGDISTLIQRVNRLISCNNQGQTYDPDAGGDGCVALPVGPEHSWNDTVLSFKNEKGVLVPGRDLQGPQGDPGANITCYPAVTSSGTSSGSCDPWQNLTMTCPDGTVIVHDHACPSGNCCTPRPVAQTCPAVDCDPWTLGNWGACEGNTRTRSVTCPSGDCCDPQPNDSETCTTSSTSSSGGGTWTPNPWGNCTANPTWATDPWGNCSATCGGGTQIRGVRCVNTNGTQTRSYTCSTSSGCDGSQPANDTQNCTENCDANVRPAGTQSCNTQACLRWHLMTTEQCRDFCDMARPGDTWCEALATYGGGCRYEECYGGRPTNGAPCQTQTNCQYIPNMQGSTVEFWNCRAGN